MNQLEQMAQMFAAIDAEGRDFILDMLAGEYERVQKVRCPVLRLIQGGPPPVASPAKTRTPRRIKSKEA